MSYGLGVLLFAVGILVSVCLHEFGHLLTAKHFGMKATQYFAGFGPTLWSFRRGETEYGVKAIPAGGFVKIVGMTPLEEVAPEDDKRAFWRFPLRQRTVVLVAGSATHFLLAIVIFFLMAPTTGLPNPALASYDPLKQPATIGTVSSCVVVGYDVDKNGYLRDCRAGDPTSPAAAAGLRSGDQITKVGSTPVSTYGELVTAIRATPAGPTPITYLRDGSEQTATVDLVATQRRPVGGKPDEVKTVSALGVTATVPPLTLHYSLLGAVPASVWYVGETVGQTFSAIGRFPAKIPKLLDAIGGQQRDPETPVSVVGASRIGGEAVSHKAPIVFLALLGGLNVFIGVFNLLPLLPLDGGHVAVAWYEKARSWLARRRGQPDPGRVDYNKLLPVTYLVILVFGGLTLLTLAADIVNPIRL
jgi:membrane-associated protease RseP (regulator of RpoE activity)